MRFRAPILHTRYQATSFLARNLILTVLFIGAGCQGREVYRACDLPDALKVPSRQNANTVDLSVFARPHSAVDLIERGDVLEVTIAAGLSAENTVTIPSRVNHEGNASLPMIGLVPVAGLDLEDAEHVIRATAIQHNLYRNPHVSVAVKTRATNRVTVLGAVENPGVYELPRQASNLVSAIVAAGGLAEHADTKVTIKKKLDRTNVSKSPFELVPIDLAQPGLAHQAPCDLPEGAIVSVARRSPERLKVLGLVNRPNRYEFPANEDLRLLDAIALAEGVSSPAADKVYIVRQLSQDSAPAVIEASIRKAKRDGNENLLLAPGDIVSVEQTPATTMHNTATNMQFRFAAAEYH